MKNSNHLEDQPHPNIKVNKVTPESNENQDSNRLIPEKLFDTNDALLNHSKELPKDFPAKRGSILFSSNDQIGSQENKSVNFMNIAKKFGEFTKTAIENRENRYQEEYSKGLVTAYRLLDLIGSKNPFLNGIKKLIFLIFQISIFVMNLLSVINLILVTDYRLGDVNPDSENFLKLMEWAIGFFFGVEVTLSILGSEGTFLQKLFQIFNFNNISNILLIIEIWTTTLYSEKFVRVNTFFIFIYILRSIKLIQLRIIIQHTVKQLRKMLMSDKNKAESWNPQNDLIYFVYNSALDIMISIFIEATCFMAVDEALDYEGYSVPEPRGLDYIAASYYSIVSITTIGYGDIYPVKLWSRIFNMFVMIFNLSVLSSFLGKFTDKVFQISPYIRNYFYVNHIVIIGDMPLTFLKYFVKELHLCDSMNSHVYIQDGKSKKTLSNIIIVGTEYPNKEIENWLENFTNDYVEIKYLQSNFLDSFWQKQSNIAFARHLFAFSMNDNEDPNKSIASDKQMAYNIQQVVSETPNVDITLILSSELFYQIKNDSLWTNVNVISAQILNEYLMANSLENQGLNTFLTHLVTLREKIAPNNSGLNNIEEYATNMGQELYPIKLPPFFNGMSFQEAMKIIYFCSVDLSDSFSIDYNGTNQIKVDNQKKSGLLLIGIECKDSVTDTLHFLINPLNYTIRTDDIGYIIAYDRNQTKSIMNFSTKSPQYNTYSKNINFFKRFKVKETSPPYINKLASDLNKHFQDWTINKSKFFKNNYKNEESAKNLNSQRHIPDIFNLNENISPKGIFINHIIIKGSLSRLSRIAVVIRSYSERPILLFSEQKENPSEWNKIREAFKNVFYIRGITSNINHITQLDPKKAFKILILSDNLNNFVLSSENIIFTRIISDFFELTNFLTELSDETHIKYLSINPKYPNMDFFFWPFFVRGSVHFSSMTMSIIAKTIINKNWISFIQNLSKTSEKKISDYEQNEKINTLVLSAEVAKEFQMLGHLQYALMTHKPQAIVIAILKTKGKENNNNKFGSTLLRKKTIGSVSVEPNSQNMISHQISRIMSNFYGSEFLMTNPSFLTPLVEGDKVLIIGKLEYNNERKMMENSVISNNDPLNIQQKYTNIDFRASTIPKTEYERRKSQVIKEKMGNAMSQLNGLITVLVNASEDIKHKLYKAPKNRVNHN